MTGQALLNKRKDNTMVNNCFLKGTKWFITPTRIYKRLINGHQCEVNPFYYNPDKRTFRVYVGGFYIGNRNRFRNAIDLAERVANSN